MEIVGEAREAYREIVMTDLSSVCEVRLNAPISTWFGVGGTADRLALPITIGQVKECVVSDASLRVLGDGANLLVNDGGVRELVVSLAGLNNVTMDAASGVVTVGAGVNLPRLITMTVREGLGGLESLGGIPASVGGALVMNAGGAFGEISSVVERVYVMGRGGEERTLERTEIAFSYRHSGLNDYIILGAQLRLVPSDPAALRERLKEVMAYKKNSQPMAENSAGCCFKNLTLSIEDAEFGPAGARVSAGRLIDRAGCKGLRIGSAEVSHVHGNFLTADKGGRASDVIALIEEVSRRVEGKFGVTLTPEVVVWG